MRLTHSQVIRMLITPRAALDRILAGGGIAFDDLGALQCAYVLAAQIENITGIKSPDNRVIVGLVEQIEAWMPVIEDRIELVKLWLDKYAVYLRRVPYSAVTKAIDVTRESIYA